MNGVENILAKKYATAFLNLHIDTIDTKHYQAFKKVSLYGKKNDRFFFLLQTPTIPFEYKQKVLNAFVEQSSLPPILVQLIALLLRQQRIILLPLIFEQIVKLYEYRKKIMPFTFFTSYALTEDELTAITMFLEKQTHNHIISHQQLQPSLIAGIRLQSDFFLWEYSIAKQIRTLRNQVIKR